MNIYGMLKVRARYPGVLYLTCLNGKQFFFSIFAFQSLRALGSEVRHQRHFIMKAEQRNEGHAKQT